MNKQKTMQTNTKQTNLDWIWSKIKQIKWCRNKRMMNHKFYFHNRIQESNQKTKKKRPTTVVYSTGRFDYLINTSLHVQVKKAIFFFFSEKKFAKKIFFFCWMDLCCKRYDPQSRTNWLNDWKLLVCRVRERRERERET